MVFTIALFAACASRQPVPGAEQVRRIGDVPYYEGADADPVRHRLDVYLPATGERWPTAVVIHGGAFALNDKSVVANIGYALARAGIATVCSNYRLFPGAHHPAQANDVARAVAWTKRHLGEYGADTNRLTLMGHSAGGFLSALVALDPRYLQAEGLSPEAVTQVAVISGTYEVDDVPVPFRCNFACRPSVSRAASPLHYVHDDGRRWLILHAERDMSMGGYFEMSRQARKLYAALVDVGVAARIEQIPDCDHNQIVERIGRQKDNPTERALLAFIGGDAE